MEINRNIANPLISVIILCYNQEHTIARTLDSVLLQETEYSFEIIIGEDASPSDNTRAICEEYVLKHPTIIRLMPKAPNKGLLQNYSDCLEACRGEYISTCAGDDWWHNLSKLQLQVGLLEKYKEYGLIFSDYRIVKVDPVNGEEIFSNSKPINLVEENIYEDLIRSNFISAATTVFRKDVFTKCINFDEFRRLGFLMEDYPMWLEMIQHTKFKYISNETITYTIAEGSISNNKTDFKKTEAFENSVLDIKRHYINKYPTKNIDANRLLEIHHHYLTSNFVKEGYFERAKYHSKFLIGAGFKGFTKYLICHTPLIKIYSKFLNEAYNE